MGSKFQLVFIGASLSKHQAHAKEDYYSFNVSRVCVASLHSSLHTYTYNVRLQAHTNHTHTCTHLLTSFCSPPKATTVLMDPSTSSATAPAAA